MTRPFRSRVTAIALLLALILLPELASAEEYASFESFYRKPWSISWILAAVVAIIAGGVVLVSTGGTAGPVATAVGTWIGGLFGYSGIAATNFGLALLGGGSVASGGLGMAGGAAVLAAAFSFSTDIVSDLAASAVFEKFEYERFAKDSAEMATLPMPRSDKGPDAYKAAMKVLEGIDNDQSLSSSENQSLIRKAISEMATVTEDAIAVPEQVRIDTMASLLYFVTNDYRKSKDRAEAAYRSANAAGITGTLPEFLLAASSLYNEDADAQEVLRYFRDSIHDEPGNPLTPLLFAIFLDRMGYRLNDGRFSASDLSEVSKVSESPNLGDQWSPIQVIIISHYLVRLKVEQQKISSLALSSNETIRDSAKTLANVRRSLRQYESLLDGAQYVSGRLSSPSASFSGDGWRQIEKIRSALMGYSQDRQRLQTLVDKLESHQIDLKMPSPPGPEAPTLITVAWIVLVTLLLTGLGALGLRRWAAKSR
jgi:hypothetical protein